MNPAFFGKVVPLAGQRRKSQVSTVARLVRPDLERLPDGRYLRTSHMQNRCCNDMEVGSRLVYVMNDYGFLVQVEDWGRAWW